LWIPALDFAVLGSKGSLHRHCDPSVLLRLETVAALRKGLGTGKRRRWWGRPEPSRFCQTRQSGSGT